jgi:hypothetical protein
MDKMRKDFYCKALLMLALAGVVVGVAKAGYDADAGDNGHSESVRTAHAQALVKTLSEEFTEVQALASQQAKFREMGDAESTRIARMYGRWIREHKAGVPMLARLIRMHGANPEDATELKKPVLGTKMEMLHATHMDHEAAVMTSQIRFRMADDDGEAMMAKFMHMRANMARRHLRQMSRFHNARFCPMCRQMMEGKM